MRPHLILLYAAALLLFSTVPTNTITAATAAVEPPSSEPAASSSEEPPYVPPDLPSSSYIPLDPPSDHPMFQQGTPPSSAEEDYGPVCSGEITVVIKDKQGNPVKDLDVALIKGLNTSYGGGDTDEQGSYTNFYHAIFEELPAELEFWVLSRQHEETYPITITEFPATFSLTWEHPHPKDLIFKAATLRFVDPDGKPVPNLQVCGEVPMKEWEKELQVGIAPCLDAVTDENGEIEWEDPRQDFVDVTATEIGLMEFRCQIVYEKVDFSFSELKKVFTFRWDPTPIPTPAPTPAD